MSQKGSGIAGANGVAAKVRSFVVENFLFGDDSRLQDNTTFLENGIIDSTGVLELVGHLESAFGIHVEDDEIVPDNLNSVNNICCYLERKLSPHKLA